MTYEEALQIAMEELDEKIKVLSDTFQGHSARIETYIYDLSMARKALMQELKEKREWVGLTKDGEEHMTYDEGYREGMQRMREVGQARIDELEANLAKAVKALENLADCVDDGCYCSEELMATVMGEGRSILAEIEGQDT